MDKTADHRTEVSGRDGKNRAKNLIWAFLAGLAAVCLALTQGSAYAVSQWSRKYKTACVTCHTVFPRLNYYGERFMRNGYQDVDAAEADGGTHRKQTVGDVALGSVDDWFGARVNFAPIEYQTSGLTVVGEKRSQWTVGRTAWLQFFTAGSIFKNVSFFDELQLGYDSKQKFEFDHGWFHFGFHNLLGPKGLVNFRVGRISPKDFTSFSNRIRIFAELPALPDKTKPSGGAGEESIAVSSETNGADYYGSVGPLLWSLGVGNPTLENKNQFLNYWTALKAEVTEEASAFEGSSTSLFAYAGTDSTDSSAAQKVNHYYRLEPAANLRYEGLDLILSLLYGKEQNLGFSDTEDSFTGFTGIAAYKVNSWFLPGVEFDSTSQERGTSLRNRRFATHLSFQPAENFNLILTSDWNILPSTADRNHKYYMTIRTMF